MKPDVKGSAEFAEIGGWKLRMRLDRWWDHRPRALVCGANPSYAGAEDNDPTIHQVMKLCGLLDAGGFTMVNFEPYIATAPADLHRWRALAMSDAPAAYREVSAANQALIRELSATAAIRIVAWGNLVPFVPTSQAVLLAMSLDLQHPLYAFGLTQDGGPKHPMARGKHRIPLGTTPVIWREAKKSAQ